jgi:DNA-binding ferritin-like protein
VLIFLHNEDIQSLKGQMTSHKHTKHWDSELSRSLEKVALAKGLIKPDPIQKQASLDKQTLDLSPSRDLMNNVFKLCQGLRAEGLIKEASEVETYYLNYKQAQTLYQAHTETGEDVVHSAHPKGSHHLVDVSGDEATVEDILDKHKKIVKMIEKTPTGKLSSASDILQAVKIALGGNPDADAILQEIKSILATVKKNITQVLATAQPDISYPNFWLASEQLDILTDPDGDASMANVGVAFPLTGTKVATTSTDGLKKLKAFIASLQFRFKPGLVMGVTGDNWELIKDTLETTKSLVDTAIDKQAERVQLIKKNQPGSTITPILNSTSSPLAQALAQIPSLKSQITAWKSNQRVATNPEALTWIDNELKDLDALMTTYQGQTVDKLPALQQALSTEIDAIKQFQQGVK